MQIEVKELDNYLIIDVIENNVRFEVPYIKEKSYFKNILNWFPKMGITDFKSEEDKDIFTLSELKLYS